MFCAFQVRVVFHDIVVVIVKSEYQNDIALDGQRLTNWNEYWGYAVGWSTVTHDQHVIQVVPGSDAKFAAYVYGHSILETSSSGYGFTASYKGLLSLHLVYYYLHQVVL